MPVTEIERTELVNQLVAAIGKAPTETLMQCVLPEGRDQLATKHDLAEAVSGLATKEELAEAVSGLATKEDLAEAVSGLATKEELAEAVSGLATKEELAAGLRVLSAETKAYVDRALARQSRMFVLALLGAMLTIMVAMYVRPPVA